VHSEGSTWTPNLSGQSKSRLPLMQRQGGVSRACWRDLAQLQSSVLRHAKFLSVVLDFAFRAMAIDRISVRGARQHNLKNIDVDIPRDKLTVITGLSGSGKSSLAFDTIYAEGQRRYVESLSAYARQFLDQLEKPDVDSVEGLSPAISIEQKTVARSPRSTIGTVTEIYDYLRLLFSSVGHPHCPQCGLRSRAKASIRFCKMCSVCLKASA
jgi:hypothetical protein